MAEFRDPPNATRMPPGTDLLAMLLAGELDAAILAEPPKDGPLRTLIPDPAAAALAWRAKHGAIQINHMVTVKSTVSDSQAQDMKRPLLRDHLLKNVYFDTCVYHQPGIDLLVKVIPAENILFASEMVGAVRGIDPETGQHYDDTRRYVEASALSDADKRQVFEGNARTVYSRWRPPQ